MTPGTKSPQKSQTKTVELALPDESATLAAARRLAAHLQAGDVVFLIGDLGAGKTTFARGVIGALPRVCDTGAGDKGCGAGSGGSAEDEVPSPTFTLVQIYERRPAPIWHVDLYRLTRPEEAEELGLDEALGEAITLIEWPDRLGRRVPANRLEVRLSYGAMADARSLELAGFGSWAGRLSAVLETAPRDR